MQQHKSITIVINKRRQRYAGEWERGCTAQTLVFGLHVGQPELQQSRFASWFVEKYIPGTCQIEAGRPRCDMVRYVFGHVQSLFLFDMPL